MKVMKFLYWKDEQAWFRPATKWERFKSWSRGLITTIPDENNLLLDFDDFKEVEGKL
jgi:hypothetical protein